MRNRAEIAQFQIQTGRPWNRRWNWLLDKPSGLGVTARYVLATCFILSGIFNGVLRFTPVFGPQDSTPWFSVPGMILLPFGLLYAWSALRLQRNRRAEAG